MIDYKQQAEMLLKRALQSIKNGTAFSVQGDQVLINIAQIEQLKRIHPYAQAEVDSALQQITTAVQKSTHLRKAHARIAASKNASTLPEIAANIKANAATKNEWAAKPSWMRFAIKTGRALRWIFWRSPRWFKITAVIILAILWAIFKFGWISVPFSAEAANPASVQNSMVAQSLNPAADTSAPAASATAWCVSLQGWETANVRNTPEKVDTNIYGIATTSTILVVDPNSQGEWWYILSGEFAGKYIVKSVTTDVTPCTP